MTVATLLYGSKQYWHTVKGHHLEYVRTVLSDENHPRYSLYSKINANLSTSSNDRASGLNLWMRLCTPYAWQDSEILQVTADLYDAFIVQYTLKSSESTAVEEVKVRGNYNSTHWLIRYVNSNHFQPLMPANEELSEFSFPPITRKNTKGKVSIPKTKSLRATDLNHPWRSPMSRMNIPEKILPGQPLREMSIIDFALIVGFNTKESICDPKYLQIAHYPKLTESREPSSLADGTETVESKVVSQEEQSIDPSQRGNISQCELIASALSTQPYKIRETDQGKPTTMINAINTTKSASAPPKPFPNAAPATVLKPVYGKGIVEAKADHNHPPAKIDKHIVPVLPTRGANTKKRTIVFITRDESEILELSRRKASNLQTSF